MAQIIYLPQPADDDSTVSAPTPVAAPQQQGGGVGLMGLLGAGLAGAGAAKYGKVPKLFGRGAPAPAAAPQAAAAAAPVAEAPPAPVAQPAAPAEPPVDLTKALDPKAAPPPPKSGFAGGQPTDVGPTQPFGKRQPGLVSSTGSSGTLLEGPPQSVIPQITGPARSIPITGPARPAGLLPAPPKSGFGAVTGDDMAQIIAARAPLSNAPNAAAFSTSQAGARQTAQDAAQAAAMESEGGGSSLSKLLGGEAGSIALGTAGKVAGGVGGLAALLNGIHQNAVIPAFTGNPNAGAKAVANAGPLTSLIEPAAVHASAQAAYRGLPTAAQGLIGLLGGGASIGARALDATDLPSLAIGAGKYLGHGLGLDQIGGGAQPAQAAPAPVTMQQNKDGTHTVTVNGVAHHPATHTVDDFVNNARAAGLTLGDLNKMYALHQHFAPQQAAQQQALAIAEQAHNQGRMSDVDYMRTLERFGLAGGAALFPDGGTP
jgi:hypothetical protein